LQGTWSGSALEAYCQQVKRCTEIALNCLEFDRQRRPNIIAITHELSEMESDTKEVTKIIIVIHVFPVACQISASLFSSDILYIYT
jgi:hypothetical protein